MCEQKITSFQIVVEDCSEDIDLLNKTIDSIKEIDYPNRWFGIVLSTKKNKNWTTVPSVVDNLKQENYIVSAVIQLLEHSSSHETFCFSTFKEADYFCKIYSGDTIDKNFLKQINSYNIPDSPPKADIDFAAGENICAIKSSLAIDYYLKFLNYDLMEKHLKEESKKRKKYIKI